MVKENIIGKMEIFIKVILLMDFDMAMVPWSIPQESITTANFAMIKSVGLGRKSLKMESLILETLKMTSAMATGK